MDLKLFPAMIETRERNRLKAERELDLAIGALTFIESEIERAIATDSELKNDQQRKARRLELQSEPSYTEARESVERAKNKKALAEITLNKIRNEFTVKKLEIRERIANLEASA
jgi:hypothetical protein